MPLFLYKARDASGKKVQGTLEAKTKEELVGKLRNMGFMTTYVAETKAGVKGESFLAGLKPISAENMIMFYVQFSNLIEAGIPILNALEVLTDQLDNKKLKSAVASVARGVEAGETFSEALSKYPAIFPKLFVSMVKAGEATGSLDVVSKRYAEYYEHQVDLSQKVKGALFYPAILLTAGVAVTLFIVTFIIPQFAEIFIKSGLKLPLPTLVLYSIGVNIKRYWYLGIIGGILFALGVKLYARSERGHFNIDRMKLKLPIVGALYRKAALSRFAKTLGTLTASGVPILQSLDITKDVVGNEVLKRVVGTLRTAVEKGEKIAEALKISGEFPADTVQMISVGEETGNLDGMLDKIAGFYNMSLGYTIKKLTTIMEPLFLLIMGGLVGFIMISMLLPMFDMIKVLKQ